MCFRNTPDDAVLCGRDAKACSRYLSPVSDGYKVCSGTAGDVAKIIGLGTRTAADSCDRKPVLRLATTGMFQWMDVCLLEKHA